SLDGKVATDFGGLEDGAFGVALQADGKIVAAGWASVAGGADFALARYNADGTLDDSFGTHGKVTTDFASSFDVGEALIVRPDGKIVVVGSTSPTLGVIDFAVARYNADGTLDSGFGSGGKVTTDFGAEDTAHAVALQADGKIVVVGGVRNPGPTLV